METSGCSNFNERNRGCIVGLAIALEAYFDQQIQASKRVGSQPCPGEEVCQVIGPLAQHYKEPVEAVCGACSKRETKPGMQPRSIADAISEAIQLDELHSVGATFPYPDSLNTYQWTCLRALERARQKEKDRAQVQQAQAAETDRMKARLGRG